MSPRWLTIALLPLAPLGCGPSIVVPSDPATTTDDADTTSTTAPPITTAATVDDGPTPTDSGVDSSSGPPPEETGNGFIMEHDHGEWFECDIFLQDCPPGEKCTPWAADGGSSWNAARCSPIADDAGAPGEPCMVEGTATSGIDDCELGAMCFWVDPDTDEGTCLALCSGSPAEPTCEDPSTQCSITGSGAIALCLPICDPVLQDCPDTMGCYPVGDLWECIPDGSEGMGLFGDPCEVVNGCAPSLVCVASMFFPGCTGPAGCCTDVCDLGDPQCTGAPQGHECVPWYERGFAPPGFEHVGACVLP